MAKERKGARYFLKLLAFLVVSVFVGLGVLICLFSPATNPGFLSDILYRGRQEKDLKQMATVSRRMMGDSNRSAAIFEQLAGAFKDIEFKDAGLNPPEVLTFKTGDGIELEGWYFKGPEGSTDTVLVCYNGFSKRLPVIAGYVKVFHDAGLSVFLFDYRGLKDKEVKFSEYTAIDDARAAYDFLSKDKGVTPEHLVIFGREMGAHAALKIARDKPCKALILEEPWLDVKSFMESVPGAIAMRLVPASFYKDNCLNNVELVGKAHPPILVVTEAPHITGAGRFYKAISSPKSYLFLEGLPPLMLAPDLKLEDVRYLKKVTDLLAGVGLDTAEVGEIAWKDNLAEGLVASKQTGKLVLVELGAEWCPPCRKMEETTYVDPDVVARINRDFIPVKMDLKGEEAQNLSDSLGIRSIPTALFMNAEGKVIKKLTGYVGPGKYLEELPPVGAPVSSDKTQE